MEEAIETHVEIEAGSHEEAHNEAAIADPAARTDAAAGPDAQHVPYRGVEHTRTALRPPDVQPPFASCV